MWQNACIFQDIENHYNPLNFIFFKNYIIFYHSKMSQVLENQRFESWKYLEYFRFIQILESNLWVEFNFRVLYSKYYLFDLMDKMEKVFRLGKLN